MGGCLSAPLWCCRAVRRQYKAGRAGFQRSLHTCLPPAHAQAVLRELDGLKKCFFRGFWARRAIDKLAKMQGHPQLRGQRCALIRQRGLRPTVLGCVCAKLHLHCGAGCTGGVSNAARHVSLPLTCSEDELRLGQLRRNDDGILDCLLFFRARGAQVGGAGMGVHMSLPCTVACACPADLLLRHVLPAALGHPASSQQSVRCALPPPPPSCPPLQVEFCTRDINLAVRVRNEGMLSTDPGEARARLM